MPVQEIMQRRITTQDYQVHIGFYHQSSSRLHYDTTRIVLPANSEKHAGELTEKIAALIESECEVEVTHKRVGMMKHSMLALMDEAILENNARDGKYRRGRAVQRPGGVQFLPSRLGI